MSERWPFPRLIAHRGGGTLAPENTLAAIRVGLDHGYRAVEFDAMLAADRVPVLMHDPTLDRTGRRAGNVSALSSTALADIDVGSWHSTRFAREPVPTLAAVLAFCRASEVWPNVEIKPAPGHETATGTVVATAVAEAYADLRDAPWLLPVLSSFSIDALQAARAEAPWLPRGWLVDAIAADWEGLARNLGVVALHVNHRRLTAARARQIVDAGFGLFCYTVNDPARVEQLFDWGVDAICTDRIDVIPSGLRVRERR